MALAAVLELRVEEARTRWPGTAAERCRGVPFGNSAISGPDRSHRRCPWQTGVAGSRAVAGVPQYQGLGEDHSGMQQEGWVDYYE